MNLFRAASKRIRESPPNKTDQVEKKFHPNLSGDSFESAINTSDPDISQIVEEVMAAQNEADIDQAMATAPDIVELICVEVYEVNNEDLISPMLNSYDALILFRLVLLH